MFGELSIQFPRRIFSTFMLMASVLLASSARGQSSGGMPPGIKLKPAAGEQIEVLFLGDWRPGQVVDVSRNEVMADFEFGASTQRRTFPLHETRYPWQAKVISPVYNWKDKSGQFSVKAAVLDNDRDANTVTLYRLDTNAEITVPIDKLSEVDQRRLEKILGNAPLKITPPPPVEVFRTGTLSMSAGWQTETKLGGVSADPPTVEVAVPSGGAVFPKLDFWDNLLSVYPIGSSAGWMAAATGSGSGHGKDDFPGRLVWATIADGKVRKVQSIPHGEILVAVDPASQKVLTVGSSDDSKSTLCVWSASPKTDKAKPIVRWISHKDSWSGNPFAEFVGPNLVIHRWGDSQYVVWDIEAKTAVYEVKQESFFDAPPVISPGKRYLALPEDKAVRLINAADGMTLATLPIEGGRTSAVAFDARGENLAVLTNNQLAIWQLGSSSEPSRYNASSVGSPFGQKLAWVDETSLLVDGKTLFDLDRELPIWNYTPAFAEVVRGSGFREVTKVASGRFCYGVQLRERDFQAFVIGAVELPGDGVRDTIARVDRDKLWTLEAGSNVMIETNCGSYNAAARSGLEAAARACGWIVQPSATIVIKAEMGRSKQQTVTYEQIGGGQSQSVTVAPYYSNVVVMDGDTRLWSTGTSSGGAPSFMWVKKDESIQSRVRETEKPDPEFFQRVEFPGKILHPRYQGGFGTSTYGKRGLIAQPLSDLPMLP
ncbi:SHD1 domain-containing protein [Roseiconus lacunae]|uniref:SHD1 domain-containing protein n=1 Tax=Roseiconus lacunae TaxID=2605694 RepID=UPI0030861621|nr:SHD1 domain-containing protein [Stieleria sp. HD01]